MPPRLDPHLVDTVVALADGLEHANVRYCLIGAAPSTSTGTARTTNGSAR
jgi:hypothetical protein